MSTEAYKIAIVNKEKIIYKLLFLYKNNLYKCTLQWYYNERSCSLCKLDP